MVVAPGGGRRWGAGLSQQGSLDGELSSALASSKARVARMAGTIWQESGEREA